MMYIRPGINTITGTSTKIFIINLHLCRQLTDFHDA